MRSSAMAFCMACLWSFSFMLEIVNSKFLNSLDVHNSSLFPIFTVAFAFVFIMLVKKMPETFNKSADEIYGYFKERIAQNSRTSNLPMSDISTQA
jgi:hypothetical protein